MKPTVFFCLFLWVFGTLFGQETLSSAEALNQYKALRVNAAEKGIKFGSPEYITYYLQLMDLLEFIDDDPELVISAYHNNGYSMYTLGLNKQVIVNEKKFFQNLERYKSKVSDSFYDVYYGKGSFNLGLMAMAYSNLKHLDSAEAMHLKNLKWVKELRSITYASAINNYGLFLFHDKKDTLAALEQFNKALSITLESDAKDHFVGSVRDNIADVYRAQGRREEALQLYKENIEFYPTITYTDKQSFDIERYIAATHQFIDLAFALGKKDEAIAYCDLMNGEIANRTPLLNFYSEAKLMSLEINERVAEAQNKTEKAYKISIQRQHLQDSIKTLELNAKSNRISTINDYTLDKLKTNYELEKTVKEAKIQAQRFKIWIISLVLSVAILVLGGLYLRRRYKLIQLKQQQLLAQQNLELATLKNEKLNTEIQSKERDLSDFAVNLSQSQQWAQELAKKLDDLKGTRGRERQKLFQEFEQSIHSKITFDDETKDFYERLDKLSHVFYDALKAKFPDLTKTELQLISLIRLNIDSHQIATLQNITLASLNTSRYRLRKKLKLSKGEDLDGFIQSL